MYALIVLCGLLLSCSERQSITPPNHKTIQEIVFTELTEDEDIDSPVIWHGPENQHWLIVTAKEKDVLIIYNAVNGKILSIFGSSGTGAGQFKRPNGISIIDDLLFVVERDNKRVQLFRLPELNSIGFIGEDKLLVPYGIFAYKINTNSYHLYITDNFEGNEEQTASKSALIGRVKHFELKINENIIKSTLVREFGDITGDGVLHIVESIFGDTENRILLIADEDSDNEIKVYTFDGTFTGKEVGKGFIQHQAEGISLYKYEDGNGYWIITDQNPEKTIFYVFDRKTFEFLASFSGKKTANTDGIVLTQKSYGNYAAGAMFAVHDDRGICVFPLTEIRNMLMQ